MKRTITRILAISMSLFHLATAFHLLESWLQRCIHLFFALLLVFLIYGPDRKISSDGKIKIVNWLFILGTILPLGFILINYDYYTAERYPYILPYTATEFIMAVLFILVLLEAIRRVSGWILPVMTLLALAHMLFGQKLPGILGHAGFDIAEGFDVAYLSLDGTFGLPLGISANYLFLFILFGAFLVESGLGKFFLDLSVGLVGHLKGGPAKIAVISSATLGMVSGSPAANVLTTGSFTIPLMKSLGYSPEFAGAVEAVASTGGMITPPVMGVLAFLMAEFSGVPYINIVGHAIIPAILFYMGVFSMVHLEALKIGLRGTQKQESRKVLKGILLDRGHLVFPIVLLVTLLVLRYSPRLSVTVSILSIPFFCFVRKETRMNLTQILTALENGAKNSLLVVIAIAIAGLLGGLIGLTGIGVKISNSLLMISGGILWITLLLVMIATLILGAGMPSIVSYTFQIPLVIPALVKIGMAPVVAHFFLIYFANLAFITPPVGMAFYAASGIANSNLMRTGVTAVKVGSAGFIVPFIFAYRPELLSIGATPQILAAFIAAMIGVYALAVGLQGFARDRLGPIRRVMALLSAFLILAPGWSTELLGLAILLIAVFGKGVRPVRQPGS